MSIRHDLKTSPTSSLEFLEKTDLLGNAPCQDEYYGRSRRLSELDESDIVELVDVSYS